MSLQTVLVLAGGLCVDLYILRLIRGIRRSRGNIMAGSLIRSVLLLERHSWRWWLWTLTGRPRLWLDRHGGGIWWPWLHLVKHPQLPGPRLPVWMFPAHMRPDQHFR